MKNIITHSILLFLGLLFSQILPSLSEKTYLYIEFALKQISMIALAFIMIRIGLKFRITKNRLKRYRKDSLVAFFTTLLPWIFCSVYFVYFLPHLECLSSYQIWLESLLISHFAAPTSIGILFTMLTSVGLAHTWIFQKIKVLAIFDDLNTVLLIIPLKILLVGMQWEIFIVLFFLISLIVLAWKKLHSIALPLNWYWVLLYSIITVIFCEIVYFLTAAMDGLISIHLEILLPAFVLGCVLAYPNDDKKKLYALLKKPVEKRVQFSVAAVFMLLVGLSMPPVLLKAAAFQNLKSQGWMEIITETPHLIFQSNGSLSFFNLAIHAIIVTLTANLGKMVPIFCYRHEASLKERLSVSLAMCCRGEVSAGILVISLSLISSEESPMVTVCILSLLFNFILITPLIGIIKWLSLPKDKESVFNWLK